MKFSRAIRHFLASAFLGAAGLAQAADVSIAVLRVDYPIFAPNSRLETWRPDLVFAGAQLATDDNVTTGQFLGHSFETEMVSAKPGELLAALEEIRQSDIKLLVVSAQADELLAVADAAPDLLIVNAGSSDTRLRQSDCRANVLHVTPSDAMRTDAIAQFASYKRWNRWLLVHGSNPKDLTLAQEYRRAAMKFGMKIVDEREILDTGGSRRVETGYVQVQRQLPVLMQNTPTHDLVVAADASDVFAPYLPFNLWDPRPTMGSAGLRPVSFNAAAEFWAGTQFQSRFEKLAGRYVTEADYDTWVALRAIGEAVVKTDSVEHMVLRDFMLSNAFKLGAFKGQPLSFRNWNGQLRQPIMLWDGRINVSVSPQEGFLHQRSPLDSLGMDQPESKCTAFRGKE